MSKRAFVPFVEVCERVSWSDAISKLNIEARKDSKGQYRGICPAHPSEDHRKFVITPGRGFYCRQSEKGGTDVIALAAHVLDITQHEAAHFLDGSATVTVPQEKTETGGTNPLQRIKDYLEPVHEVVQALGIGADTARDWGIGFAPKGTMAGRVLFPLYGQTGEHTGYIGLSSEKEPRWKLPSNMEPSHVIYGAERLEEGDEVCVLSSPLEVVIAAQSGETAIAFLTETVMPIQCEMFAALLETKKLEWRP